MPRTEQQHETIRGVLAAITAVCADEPEEVVQASIVNGARDLMLQAAATGTAASTTKQLQLAIASLLIYVRMLALAVDNFVTEGPSSDFLLQHLAVQIEQKWASE